MDYHVTIAGVDRVVAIDGNRVTLDGTPVEVDFVPVSGDSSGGRCVVRIGDAAIAVGYSRQAPASDHAADVATWLLSMDGSTVAAVVMDDRERQIRSMAAERAAALGPKAVTAPMPGMVVKVDVEVGDRVGAGQGVVVVEAMKMENELQAHGPGIVSVIHATPGQAVEKDQLLVEFTKDE